MTRYRVLTHTAAAALLALAAAAALLLCPTPAARAAWGRGGCDPAAGPVGPFVLPLMFPLWASAPTPVRYEWSPFPGDDSQVALMRDGVQVGAYSFKTNTYHRREGAGFSAAVAAPIDPPATPAKYSAKKAGGCGCAGPDCVCGGDCPCKQGKPRCADGCGCSLVGENYGVDLSRLSARPRCSVSGREVTEAEAWDAIAGGQVPDDSASPWLVVVGDDAARKRVLDAIDPAVRGRFKIKQYPPAASIVKERGWAPGVATFAGRGQKVWRQNADGDWESAPADAGQEVRRVPADATAGQVARALAESLPEFVPPPPAPKPQPPPPPIGPDAPPASAGTHPAVYALAGGACALAVLVPLGLIGAVLVGLVVWRLSRK